MWGGGILCNENVTPVKHSHQLSIPLRQYAAKLVTYSCMPDPFVITRYLHGKMGAYQLLHRTSEVLVMASNKILV